MAFNDRDTELSILLARDGLNGLDHLLGSALHDEPMPAGAIGALVRLVRDALDHGLGDRPDDADEGDDLFKV